MFTDEQYGLSQFHPLASYEDTILADTVRMCIVKPKIYIGQKTEIHFFASYLIFPKNPLLLYVNMADKITPLLKRKPG
jgi:hypothetical protein